MRKVALVSAAVVGLAVVGYVAAQMLIPRDDSQSMPRRVYDYETSGVTHADVATRATCPNGAIACTSASETISFRFVSILWFGLAVAVLVIVVVWIRRRHHPPG